MEKHRISVLELTSLVYSLKKKKKNAHLLLRSKQEFSLRIGHGSIYAIDLWFKSTNFLQPRRSRLRPERATRFSEFAEI